MSSQRWMAAGLWSLLILGTARVVLASDAAPEWWYESFANRTGKPTTMTKGGDDYLVYHNLWHHNERFLVVEDNSVKGTAQSAAGHKTLSQNIGLMTIPIKDAKEFYANTKAAWVGGTTLLLDYPFPAYPDNQGHWTEILLPIYNQMMSGDWLKSLSGKSRSIDRILLVNLRRDGLQGLLWVQALLKLVLRVPKDEELPPVLVLDNLDELSKIVWICFEDVLVVSDRYKHPAGLSAFRTTEIAQAFRNTAYEEYGIIKPQPWQLGGAPKTITLVTAVGGEEVVNRDALVEALDDVAVSMGMRLRPFSITPGASMQSHIHAMAHTGVLVSRHGPLLANTMFLPPGAVVLEMLPYNWEWRDISRMYLNISRSLGDIHHMGWRASSSRFVRYASPEDTRYAGWTPAECHSSYCLEAHARAGMIADTDTISEMLLDILPAVFCGESPDALRRPWPTDKAP